MSKLTNNKKELTTMIEIIQMKFNVAAKCAAVSNCDNYVQAYNNMLYGSDIKQRKIVYPELDEKLTEYIPGFIKHRDAKEITEEQFDTILNVIKISMLAEYQDAI